jgi:hypothetical protein
MKKLSAAEILFPELNGSHPAFQGSLEYPEKISAPSLGAIGNEV